MKLARSWVLVLLALMTSGCALFQTTHLEPTADTAVVRSGQWGEFYRGGYVRIESVSGHDGFLTESDAVTKVLAGALA